MRMLLVERDQERSKTHMAVVDKENTMAQVKLTTQEVESLRNELQVCISTVTASSTWSLKF